MARLDVALVERGLFESRAKARAAIEAGGVSVDGVLAARPAMNVGADTVIEARAAHGWVGRGALKLVHALDLWPVRVKDAVVLDLGASTGGFTEVCLKAGAARVYAVDVGHGQFHPRIAADPRVISLEKTDARALTAALIDRAPDLIVCDLSFISLEKALPAALSLAGPEADLTALVKPQFEVGRAGVGKGGIVTEPARRAAAVEGFERFLETQGWRALGRTQSPIQGGDGNVEFLVWAQRTGPTP